MAKVSVVIPLFNKEQYIKRALTSVLNQSFQDFSIVVVDDGSTDSGPSIVKGIKDPRLSLIRQVNRGPGPARNLGISLSGNEYIAFLDADDEWRSGYLDRALDLFEQYKHQGVVSVTQGYSEPLKTERALVDLWDRRKVTEGIYFLKEMKIEPESAVHLLAYMSPWSTVFLRETLMKYGGFFEKYKCLYGEDSFLMIQILLNEKVYISRERNVVYHSEASELALNLTSPHEIEPFLTNKQDIYNSCPEECQNILDQILMIRAKKTARLYIFSGKGSVARDLLKDHCKRSLWKNCCKLYFLSFFAPLIFHLRILKKYANRGNR